MRLPAIAAAVLVALPLVARPDSAAAQSAVDRGVEVGGEIGATALVMPRRDVAELRPEAVVEAAWRPAGWLRLRFDARATGLVADRNAGEAVTDVAVEVRDGWVEAGGARADLRAGYGRIVWGRLDEVQPTDVVNPIDAARFILEGRSAARRGVAFLRGRLFGPRSTTLEAVLVPAFRRGTYDALDEPTSPFNLTADATLPPGVAAASPFLVHDEPSLAWRNVSGGARLTTTIDRVDVGVAAFRGFEGFGPVTVEVVPGAPTAAPSARLDEHHTRFTMLGGDFETVAGDWVWRGEAAFFVERALASADATRLVDGRAIEAGVGVDRAVGRSRVFGSVLARREWSADDPLVSRTDWQLVGSLERRFSRDRYLARVFSIVNPSDAAAFVRGVFAWSVRDNLGVEWSAGAFLGEGDDVLGRFRTRDFALARLRYHF